MASGFVSTAVLTSEDGVGFSKETRKETDEVKLAEKRNEHANAKPLFQQLAENQEKKQEEYDAVTKLIFSGPRKLDEEDVEHYECIEERRQEAFNKKRRLEEESVNEFAALQKARVLKAVQTSTPNNQPDGDLHNHDAEKKEGRQHETEGLLGGANHVSVVKNSGPAPPVIVVKKKQKKEKKKKKAKKEKKTSPLSSSSREEKQEESKNETGRGDAGALAGLLASYDDNSDESNDDD
uniref:FAM192A/Fyv6 N-terminal domain-containing protein n=1 Tax=Heterosigma akashiwo TaxID=2829 RepID=A0A6V1RVK1_HETAK|mmetsp:Transcript_22312/g.38430  ORF Transcript_22312/g.38430 Transcript_22312/m.38430 type:complete len:237 (-) Transcript_22312:127-837(-)